MQLALSNRSPTRPVLGVYTGIFAKIKPLTVSELRALEVTSPVAIVDGDAIMKAAMAPVIQEIRIETPGAAHDNAAVDSPKDMNVFRLNGAIPQGLDELKVKRKVGQVVEPVRMEASNEGALVPVVVEKKEESPGSRTHPDSVAGMISFRPTNRIVKKLILFFLRHAPRGQGGRQRDRIEAITLWMQEVSMFLSAENF